MEKQFGKDFTSGSIPRQLLKFLLPILLGNLVTTGYSIVNAVWVGRLLGSDAMGAVATTFPMIMIVNALVTGMTTAAAILIARLFGSKRLQDMQKVVNCSWTVALGLSAVVTAAGIAFAAPLLQALGTPQALLGMAASYMRITFAGVVFLYISQLVVAILRGVGDTATPMAFMVMSTVINAVLDPLLIAGFGPLPALGLNGAALASLIATASATLAGILYMRGKYRGQPVNFTKPDFNKKTIGQITLLGLPSFAQQALVSLSAAFVVAIVNGFGTDAIAAYGVTSRVDSIAIMPAMSMFMAVSTLTAQNLGAGRADRVKGICKWGLVFNAAIIAVVSAAVVIFSGPVMHLFVREGAVVALGRQYFTIVGASYLLFAVSFVTNGVINGAGRTVSTMLFSLVSLCAVRIPLALLLSRTGLGLAGVWLAIALSYGGTTVLSLGYYMLGKWNKTRKAEVKSIVSESEVAA